MYIRPNLKEPIFLGGGLIMHAHDSEDLTPSVLGIEVLEAFGSYTLPVCLI